MLRDVISFILDVTSYIGLFTVLVTVLVPNLHLGGLVPYLIQYDLYVRRARLNMFGYGNREERVSYWYDWGSSECRAIARVLRLSASLLWIR